MITYLPRFGVRAVNAGHISQRQSEVNALTQWANDQERRLLGLHCGQMLDRKRHRDWAERIISAG